MTKCIVRAGSNIAFIKYWGVADPSLNLPLNSSVSMTLADAHTTTTVEWLPDGDAHAGDSITINNAPVSARAYQRTVAHLDRIRALAQTNRRARIASVNNFPLGAGIASSASGFAALTVAATQALELDISPAQLAALTRKGSGSACRSLYGGFVLWEQGHDDATSLARPLHPPEHWALYDVVAVVDSHEKSVSSASGHTLAHTSPLNDARVAAATDSLAPVCHALAARDLAALGPHIERDALAMHAVMMTSTPNLVYWQPGTLRIIRAVLQWRNEDGVPVYFTIDAGPNVHLICEGEVVDEIVKRLKAIEDVRETLISRPGPGPRTVDAHLF